MEFKVNIKNLGKLSEADVEVRNFTVLAGQNNTGKTFVSKALYSLLSAMNCDLIGESIRDKIYSAQEALERVRMTRKRHARSLGEATLEAYHSLPTKENTFFEEMKDRLEQLMFFANVSPDIDMHKRLQLFDKTKPERGKVAKEISDISRNYRNNLEERERNSSEFMRNWEFWEDAQNNILRDIKKDGQDVVFYGLETRFRRNLRGNFQTKDLLDLIRRGENGVEIKVENIASFFISRLREGRKGFLCGGDIEVEELQRLSGAIYLESPIYWKLQNVLERSILSSQHMRRGREVSIPQYFSDLMADIREVRIKESEHMDLHDSIAEKIGGKLVISERNELLFEEGENIFPLPVTAMGIANFGMLGLLIEKGLIVQDTFLFIDEPEAHLHPAWQVEMANTLFELAKRGTNVVIATHSPDILKWLEVTIKEKPEDEGLVALNHFSADGRTKSNEDFSEKLSDIAGELASPYYKLYMRGL